MQDVATHPNLHPSRLALSRNQNACTHVGAELALFTCARLTEELSGSGCPRCLNLVAGDALSPSKETEAES